MQNTTHGVKVHQAPGRFALTGRRGNTNKPADNKATLEAEFTGRKPDRLPPRVSADAATTRINGVQYSGAAVTDTNVRRAEVGAIRDGERAGGEK